MTNFEKFIEIVKNNIGSYSDKYGSKDIQLCLVDNNGRLNIEVLCDYSIEEEIKVKDLKGIFKPVAFIIENKIISLLSKYKSKYANPKCMLSIEDGKVIAILYNDAEPIGLLDVSKLID